MTHTAADWQRLDSRMLAVTPLRQLVGFLPVIAVVLIIGVQQDLGGRIYGVGVGVLVVVLAGVLRWVTTRYRITSERVELRSGLLFRSARSVPRDRIRSVDITAGPVHRLFRLSVVTVGTGERSEGIESRELTLDAISTAEADRLRQRLLDSLEAGDAGDPNLPGATAAPSPTELATLDWSWLRFAPLTASSLVAVGAVAGAVGQLVGELGAELADLG
ncbi:MAG TPA: PH domain-containing protein, partial [Pseudonocardiaceae bacterium]